MQGNSLTESGIRHSPWLEHLAVSLHFMLPEHCKAPIERGRSRLCEFEPKQDRVKTSCPQNVSFKNNLRIYILIKVKTNNEWVNDST